LLWATFLTISEFAPIVVLPASSVVGSPVVKLVFGSVFAGAGQVKSTPVPLLLTVAVESGPTGVADGDAAGLAEATGDGDGLAFWATAASAANRTAQNTEASVP
jgi:hypothetical protein